MRKIHIEIEESVYHQLQLDAAACGLTVRQLVHDRVTAVAPGDRPQEAVRKLVDELEQHRNGINAIVKAAMDGTMHLYEDDILRIEASQAAVEMQVADYISWMMRRGS